MGRAGARTVRFWLPHSQPFSYVAIDFHIEQARFSLRCFRRNRRAEAELVNAVPNSYRLRELEDTLVELQLCLPRHLRSYFIAVLGEDVGERLANEPYVRELSYCRAARMEDEQLERVAS